MSTRRKALIGSLILIAFTLVGFVFERFHYDDPVEPFKPDQTKIERIKDSLAKAWDVDTSDVYYQGETMSPHLADSITHRQEVKLNP